MAGPPCSGCGSIGGAGGSTTTPTGGSGGTSLSGPLAYYNCDNASGATLLDSSGNGNDGQLTAAATSGYAFVAGKVGKALSLARAGGGFVYLPTTLFANATDITIAAWVNVTPSQSLAPVFDVGIFAGLTSNVSTGTRYMYLVPGNADTNFVLVISKNGYANQQGLISAVPATYTWTHVAVVLGSGSARLYVDGVEAASSSSLTLRPKDLGAIDYAFLGRSQFSADPFFDGMLDEIRVYGRALSASEIQALYGGP